MLQFLKFVIQSSITFTSMYLSYIYMFLSGGILTVREAIFSPYLLSKSVNNLYIFFALIPWGLARLLHCD